jgi:hypothetical protein
MSSRALGGRKDARRLRVTDFDRSSDLVRQVHNIHGFRTAVRSVPVLLSHAPSLARLFLGLPTVNLDLTAGLPGLRIAARHGRRSRRPWTRFARAVLAIPEDFDAYLTGRSKHALRNNLNRATATGLTCVVVPPEDISKAVQSVLRARGELAQHTEVVTRCRYLATDVFGLVDRGGAIVAVAAVDVDARCAVIELMLQAEDCMNTGGRFLLHTHIVRVLVGRSVPWLLAGSALQLTAGHQYFQSRLGYEPKNLRIHLTTSEGPNLRKQDGEALAVAYQITRDRAGGRTRFSGSSYLGGVGLDRW